MGPGRVCPDLSGGPVNSSTNLGGWAEFVLLVVSLEYDAVFLIFFELPFEHSSASEAKVSDQIGRPFLFGGRFRSHPSRQGSHTQLLADFLLLCTGMACDYLIIADELYRHFDTHDPHSIGIEGFREEFPIQLCRVAS